MKNTTKHKRFWSWTKKNLQKSRNKNNHWMSGPTKDFVKIYKRSFKAKIKSNDYNAVKNNTVEYVINPTRTYKNSAKWEWY